MNIADFAGRSPTLSIERYFSGSTEAWGLVEDRFGRIRRQLHVTLEGRPTGDGFRLAELFRYDNGREERRIWHLRATGPGRYQGKAADVVGLASGEAAGPALHWRYRLRIRIGRRSLLASFDDWMLLQPDGTLINRARFSKWGVRLGQVTLVFRPRAAEPAAAFRAPAAGDA